MADYLNEVFGNEQDESYFVPGISRLALTSKPLIASISRSEGGTGHTVTAVTFKSGATFQEIYYAGESVTLGGSLTNTDDATYFSPELNFKVKSRNFAQADKIVLGRKQVALIQDKSGAWYLIGFQNGLKSTAAEFSMTNDATSMSFTLSQKEPGFPLLLDMAEADIEALINS